MALRRVLLGTTLVAVPVSTASYLAYTTSTLDERYPRLPSSSSPLSTSTSPTRVHSHSGPDLFGATIPTSLLPANRADWSSAWTRAFLSTPSSNSKHTSLDPGQVLANGVFVVDNPTDPIVVHWDFPEPLVKACEVAAAYGYPWRFMSGGRHSFEVCDEGNGNAKVVFGSQIFRATMSSDSNGSSVQHTRIENSEDDLPSSPPALKKAKLPAFWGSDEDSRLRNAKAVGSTWSEKLSWLEVAKAVGGGRSASACEQRYRRIMSLAGNGTAGAADKTENSDQREPSANYERTLMSPELFDFDDTLDDNRSTSSSPEIALAHSISASTSSEGRDLVQPTTPDIKPDLPPALSSSKNPFGMLSKYDTYEVPDGEELADMEAKNDHLARVVAAQQRNADLTAQYMKFRESEQKFQVKVGDKSKHPTTPSKLAGVWRHKRIIVSPEEDDDDNDPGPPSPVKTPVESGPVPSPSPSSQRRNLIEPPTPDPDSKSTLVHSHTPHTSHIGSLSSLEGIRIPEEDELAAIEASNGRLARLVAARKRTLELSEEFKMLPTPLTSRSGVEVKSEDSKVVKMEDSQPSKKQKVGPRRKSKGKGRESDLIDLTLSDDD
ncbi:hypothetical protein RQP46_001407 [Phenoliferia psychrophenolica]